MAGNDLNTPCRICGTTKRHRQHIARREGNCVIYTVICVDCLKREKS